MNTSFEYSQVGNMNSGVNAAYLRINAAKAFYQAYNRGKRSQFLAKIFGRENLLQTLSSQPVSSHSTTSRIVSVPIRKIKGSLGRSEDFDANFNPLQERSRSRWISIATAVRMGIPMPAVELVQVGDNYFVRDGHHRISVARNMGQEAVDAQIVN